MIYPNGKCIKGWWSNDKLNGKGVVVENGVEI